MTNEELTTQAILHMKAKQEGVKDAAKQPAKPKRVRKATKPSVPHVHDSKEAQEA